MATARDLVDFHIEVGGNFQKVCDNLVNWVIMNDLKKEQIISITANETTVENADAMLVLIYKKEQEPSMTSLQKIAYHLMKNTVDWDEQYKELADIANNNAEVLSLTHTPRNLG